MNLMSRHRLGHPGGHDMGLTSRPGLLNLGSRHHFEVATWLVQLGEEMMSRHSLVSRPGLASVRSRPGLVSRPGYCSGHCSWTLFMSIVHRVKKKSTKFLNFFLCMF